MIWAKKFLKFSNEKFPKQVWKRNNEAKLCEASQLLQFHYPDNPDLGNREIQKREFNQKCEIIHLQEAFGLLQANSTWPT